MSDTKINDYNDYILTALSLLIVVSAAIYRFYALNTGGIIGTLLISAAFFVIILRFWRKSNKKEDKNLTNQKTITAKINKKTLSYFWQFLFLVFAFISYRLLFFSRTTEALISPWQAVTPTFFLVFVVTSLILFLWFYYHNYRQHRPYWSLALIGIYFFLAFSVNVIVYVLGFGFDGFIHTATMELINAQGQVLPKPFYYLGYYGLIIILHKITFLPITFLNTWLVPFLAALLLPMMLYRALKHLFPDKRNIYLTIFFILILPFFFLTASTPQQLAYLFVLLAIIRGIINTKPRDLFMIFLLSLSALAIHPLAGIPAFYLCLFILVFHSKRDSLKPHLYRLLFIASAITLPIIFLFLEKTKNITNSKAKSWPSLGGVWQNLFSHLSVSLPQKENIFLNTIYFFYFNRWHFILLLIVAGLLLARKYRRECRPFTPYLYLSLSLFVSYFIMRQFSFSYLIYYEQANYTARVLFLAILFLLPFILLTVYAFFLRLNHLQNKQQIFFYAFLLLLLPISLYLNYPRFDNYYNSRGYSLSQADIEAVKWIHQDAGNNDYIVLANQQVSAAALKEFGFVRYFKTKNHNNIFYYPIPTSSPLYEYYLDMVYKQANKETMLKAMDLAQVNTAYFVLNKYWWAFDKIFNQAKLTADKYQDFHKKKIFVFKYSR